MLERRQPSFRNVLQKQPPLRSALQRQPALRNVLHRQPPLRNVSLRQPTLRNVLQRRPPLRSVLQRQPPLRSVWQRQPPLRNVQEHKERQSLKELVTVNQEAVTDYIFFPRFYKSEMLSKAQIWKSRWRWIKFSPLVIYKDSSTP